MSIPKPLLAETLDESNIHLLRFPVLASPKLDGIRARVIDGQFVSRNGKTFKNKHLLERFDSDDMKLLERFDGEFIYGSPTDYNAMQATTSSVMAFEGPIDQLRFYVFDFIHESADATHRYNTCKNLIRDADYRLSCVEVLPKVLLHSIEELDDYESHCLSLGYEGVMVQDPHGKYKFGRASIKTQELLKIKRFADSEAVITGFYEGMHNENEAEKDAYGHTTRSSKKENMIPSGSLGGFYAFDEKNNWDLKIGSGRGLTLELRKEIWDNRDQYIGKIVKFKYFANAGMKDKPRFPIFLGFRDPDDMGGE